MAYTVRKDRKGQYWLIDYAAANNVINGLAYVKAFAELARLKSVDHSWLTRAIDTVEFDHAAVRTRKNELAAGYSKAVNDHLNNGDGQDAFALLASYHRSTVQLRMHRSDLFAKADQSFRTSDKYASLCLSTAQLARDASFAAIGIVALPVGGGFMIAATAASAAGAALGKYQDTGNAEAAAIAGTGALIMCGIGIVGTAVGTVGRGVCIASGVVVDGSFEYVGAKAEKKTDAEARKAALLKGLFSLLGAAADNLPLASKMDEMADKAIEAAAKITEIQAKGSMGKWGLDAAKKTVEKVYGERASFSSNPETARKLAGIQGQQFIRAKVMEPIVIR